MSASVMNNQKLVVDLGGVGPRKQLFVFTGMATFGDGGFAHGDGIRRETRPVVVRDSGEFTGRFGFYDATVVASVAASAFDAGGLAAVDKAEVKPVAEGLGIWLDLAVQKAALYKVSYQVTAVLKVQG